MANSLSTTPKLVIARATLAEIDDNARSHRLRAASFKFQTRLHEIEAAYFAAEADARADYLAEVAEINGEASR